MKLSKKSWLLITIGVFTIMFVGLWMVHSQQADEQKQLEDKLNTAELKLNGFQTEQLSNRQKELEEQLSQILSQSETARDILSQPIGSITISSIMFDIAEAYNVEVTEISSSGLASEELAGLTCSTLPLNATVEGDMTDLVGFITRLNGDLENGVVNSVEINAPEVAGEKASASIQMIIYTYQGG